MIQSSFLGYSPYAASNPYGFYGGAAGPMAGPGNWFTEAVKSVFHPDQVIQGWRDVLNLGQGPALGQFPGSGVDLGQQAELAFRYGQPASMQAGLAGMPMPNAFGGVPDGYMPGAGGMPMANAYGQVPYGYGGQVPYPYGGVQQAGMPAGAGQRWSAFDATPGTNYPAGPMSPGRSLLGQGFSEIFSGMLTAARNSAIFSGLISTAYYGYQVLTGRETLNRAFGGVAAETADGAVAGAAGAAVSGLAIAGAGALGITVGLPLTLIGIAGGLGGALLGDAIFKRLGLYDGIKCGLARLFGGDDGYCRQNPLPFPGGQAGPYPGRPLSPRPCDPNEGWPWRGHPGYRGGLNRVCSQ